MKRVTLLVAGMTIGGLASADSVVGVDEIICAAGQVQICIEQDTCYATSAADLDVPEFVLIDTKKGTISTTKASGLNRSTEFTKSERKDGLIHLQGVEGGRAFSFVIHEETGRMTAAIARDGLSVTVFGACTVADL